MKWDMAGAGTVVGLMAALAGRKAKVNAVGLVGLVENMLSGRAQRPGDVVRTASGQTVEVLNTDAEGRLVLADVLWYAQDRFKPRAVIDLATLTGAIIVALGHEHAGLYSNDDALAQRLLEAGQAVGEKLWRMPLADAYDKGAALRHRRHEEHRRPPRRLDHRSTVPQALRQRRGPGRISTSPGPLGRPRTRRGCRRAPPRSAYACSTAWWRRITRIRPERRGCRSVV